jgi:hypothetical protein
MQFRRKWASSFFQFCCAIDAQLPPGAPRPKKFDVREEIAYLHQLAETVKAGCQKELAAKRLDPKTEEARNRLHTALVKAGPRAKFWLERHLHVHEIRIARYIIGCNG